MVAIGLTAAAVMRPALRIRRLPTSKQRTSWSRSQRQEGQAILDIADAALAGRSVPAGLSDPLAEDEFLKARQGTFVPFTLTVDVSKVGPICRRLCT